MKPKAIIIGATSGIGRALAQVLADNGYYVGITGRRVKLLEELRASRPDSYLAEFMDLSEPEQARAIFNAMVEKMDGVDLVIVNSGTGKRNEELDWSMDQTIIAVNVSGCVAIANAAMHVFFRQGHGHLVGISSIAALRGSRYVPTYPASKAFLSTYLEGLRHKVRHKKRAITITDIQPGFVDTAMAQGDYVFWRAPVDKAARQIYQAICKKKKRAYITRRWRLIAWIQKTLPDFLYHKI
ncbi:MAG: SDR family NAD(P)-dependent oxidoreductase [Sedimentisphaerales bacterium]|nr:SDR family NAD(P)-dependent oxidoreductase [Sedimentisphaerales bacterium]